MTVSAHAVLTCISSLGSLKGPVGIMPVLLLGQMHLREATGTKLSKLVSGRGRVQSQGFEVSQPMSLMLTL